MNPISMLRGLMAIGLRVEGTIDRLITLVQQKGEGVPIPMNAPRQVCSTCQKQIQFIVYTEPGESEQDGVKLRFCGCVLPSTSVAELPSSGD